MPHEGSRQRQGGVTENSRCSDQTRDQPDDLSHPGPPVSKKAKPDDLFKACFEEITEKHDAEEARNSDTQQDENVCLMKAAQEVDYFMKLPLLPRTSDPLKWWRHDGFTTAA